MKTAEEIFNESSKSGMAYGFSYDTDVISLQVAIEIAEIYANQSKWISIKDRVPEVGENIMWYEDGEIGMCFFEGIGEGQGITIWQPLPKSPPISPPKHQQP